MHFVVYAKIILMHKKSNGNAWTTHMNAMNWQNKNYTDALNAWMIKAWNATTKNHIHKHVSNIQHI